MRLLEIFWLICFSIFVSRSLIKTPRPINQPKTNIDMNLIKNLKATAIGLKQELVVLHLAYQHPKTPWTAKALIILVIGYALSPIDLIPDFIPVIGLLDDLILLPIGIYWAIQLIPKDVMELCRIQAETYTWVKKKNIIAGLIIGLFWLVVMYFSVHAIIHKA